MKTLYAILLTLMLAGLVVGCGARGKPELPPGTISPQQNEQSSVLDGLI